MRLQLQERLGGDDATRWNFPWVPENSSTNLEFRIDVEEVRGCRSAGVVVGHNQSQHNSLLLAPPAGTVHLPATNPCGCTSLAPADTWQAVDQVVPLLVLHDTGYMESLEAVKKACRARGLLVRCSWLGGGGRDAGAPAHTHRWVCCSS